MTKIKVNKIHIKGIRSFGRLLCVLIFAAAMITGDVFFFARVSYATAAENPAGNKYGFADGDGSKDAPFVITNAVHLDNMRNYPYYDVLDSDGNVLERFGYYFTLAADIDLAAYLSEGNAGYNGGAGWEPVGGDGTNGFYGTFDGGGHTISGLWINNPEDNFTGFFGRVYDGEITMLNIVLGAEKVITGGSCTGGLIGDVGSSVIKKCSVTGSITVNGGTHEDYEAGGFFGNLGDSKVSECRFTGSVTFIPAVTEAAFVCIGGIAGRVTSAEITNCLVRAGIRGGADTYSAGLSGSYFSSSNTASGCFIALSGDERVFPFFGTPTAPWGASASVINCYYYDTDAFARVFDNYPHETDGNSQRLTALNPDKSEYGGLDFDSVWGFDKDGNLVLRAFGGAYNTPAPPVPPDLTWLYITLPCLLFAAAVIIAAIMLYRRKKTQIIRETVVERQMVEVSVEVIKEVPMLKKPLPADLSEQERRVAELVLKGKSRPEICNEMKLSEGTVKTYIARIYTKAGVDNQRQFAARYLSDGDTVSDRE